VLWSRVPSLDGEQLCWTEPGEEPGSQPAEPWACPAIPTYAGVDPLPGPLPPAGVDLGQWEKTMIEQALREAGGNQTRAAQRLGISRDTLRYRLKKFGIQG